MKILWNHDINNPVFVKEFDCGHQSREVSKLADVPPLFCEECGYKKLRQWLDYIKEK